MSGAIRKAALVTGASRGVGRAIAVALAGAGYRLALLARSADGLEETARLCRAAGAAAEAHPIDITDTATLTARLPEITAGLGGLDVLVNNAGVSPVASTLAADPAAWDETLDINLRAVMQLTRLCLPALVESGRGSALFISSQGVHFDGVPGLAPYLATKHGLRGFAESLFEEVRDHGVRVSCICPGLVNTAMGAELRAAYPEFLDLEPDATVQPADVADAVLYVLGSSATCCPVEVIVEPMAVMIREFRDAVEAPTNRPGRPITAPGRPVALVTGASRGIGSGVAEGLARRGYDLAIMGRAVDDLEAVAEACRAHGVEVVAQAFDIGDSAALEAAVNQTVERLGNLRVVVSNAAVNRRKSALGTNAEVWDEVIRTNLVGAMHLARLTLPYLCENPGEAALVFVSSLAVQARFGMPGLAPYFASKYGLEGFAMSVFSDVCGHGVKVASLCPGITNTPLGRRPGPIGYAVGADAMLQPADVAAAVGYVLDSGPTACPTRILLQSQGHMFRFKQAAARRLDAAAP